MNRFLSILFLFSLISCSTMMEDMERGDEISTTSQATSTNTSSSSFTENIVPASQDVYETLRGLAPYWRRCIDPYVRQIPRDEMVELALDFTITSEGRVANSSWSYMDFSDSLPGTLRSCLDQALRTRRFQSKGSPSKVSKLSIRFNGRRNF